MYKLHHQHSSKITYCKSLPCAGQEKTQVRLPGASKFCSWASENGSLVAWWASETSLSSLVSDNSSQKQLKNLRLQDEQNNELKALIYLKSKQTLLAFCPPISIVILL